MADRFPSIDDLDSSSTAPTTTKPSASGDLLDGSDPASDFLAREAAVLGTDAAQFSTPTDSAPKAPPPTKRQATMEEHEDGEDSDDDDGDLLGGGADSDMLGDQGLGAAAQHGGGELDGLGDDEFESRYPAESTNNQGVGAGGSITGTNMPIRSIGGQQAEDEEEPEVVQQWRTKRDADIAHRASISQKKKSSTLKQAQEAIDEFYENYNNKKDKNIAQTRKEAEEYLNSRQDTTSGGTSWQRISKLVDLNAGGKGKKGVEEGGEDGGKERFRGLLRDLAKDEKAPGASGY